jgi:rod shape-determining protein MreC
MPVVTQQGLVGRVDAVIAAAARVKLITDSTSIVNIRLQTAGIEAQLEGSLTGDVFLDMIPLDEVIEPGDVVLTSGLGGNYPPNIFVGQVLSTQRRENALFQTASVQPIVDFSSINAVLVVSNFEAVDISPLVPEP